MEHASSVGEVGILCFDKLNAGKIAKSVKTAPLVDSEGELMPNAKAIFENWFDIYSEDVEGEGRIITFAGFTRFMEDTTAAAGLGE